MRRAVLGPAALLFAGTFLGALLGYGFFLVVGHALSSDELGAVGSLVNLSTILSVPALGLQLVTARDLAGAEHDLHGLVPAAAIVGGVPAVGLVLVSPALTPALHLASPAPLLALAAGAVPMAVTYAGLGVAQGHERFALIGVLALLTGVVKIGAGALAVTLGQGVTGVTAWFCAGWLVLAVAVWPLLRPGQRVASNPAGPGPGRRVRDALAGCLPTAGLLVLSSIDLLLARHHLAAAASGTYTVGALFEKVAFWGPQFLATMAYPRLSRPAERAGALRQALGLTLAIGAVGTVATALLGGPLVRLVAGPGYVADLGPNAWLYTAAGVGLALAQVLVYADLAVHGHRVGLAVWVGALAVVCVVAARHGSPATVAAGVLAVVIALDVVALALTRRAREDQPSVLPAP